MPCKLRRTTAYAAYTLSAFSVFTAVTGAHAHGPSRLERGAAMEKRQTLVYSGCYSSSNGLTDQGYYQFQTQGYCQPICVNKNDAVLGLSGGSHCWCGSVLPPADSKVNESNCNTPCNGYGQDMCKTREGETITWAALTRAQAEATTTGPSTSLVSIQV
jgi:cell wall integrity and stress response component